MFRLGATIRLVIGLVCLAISCLLAARTFGFIPDELSINVDSRAATAETIALHCSSIVAVNATSSLDDSLEMIVERNQNILSAAVRRTDGCMIAVTGDHEACWGHSNERLESQVFVPIIKGSDDWGVLELRFKNRGAGWWGWLTSMRDLIFVAVFSLIAYFFYLRKMLSHLDPSRVIPARVRTAFDTLAQGLLVLDEEEQIVLANRAFAQTIQTTADELQGKSVNELPWKSEERELPWQLALERGSVQAGRELKMATVDDDIITYRVNAAPIKTEDNAHRGVLVSFDDITLLEQRKQELNQAMTVLQESREKIRLQNEELMILATQDPLTGCLNRRSFFERVDALWQQAKRYDQPLSCLLMDVDHFKLVNDNHGHSVGDEVLRCISTIIKQQLRKADVLCRYGGEEFCVILPQLDIEQSAECAERLRLAIEAARPGGLDVTSSFGVSTLYESLTDVQLLLDEADKSLYVAKRAGRNRVVRWDQVDVESLEQTNIEEVEQETIVPLANDVEISFQAVIGLISALSYRDAETAAHSRRVADLCAEFAHDKLSARDGYVLEMAALLHDIGKIGIPDSVLLKPGPLTEDEWKIMNLHDTVSVDIINSTFTSPELSDIVKCHHAWYANNDRDSHMPIGDEIPYGARLLSIADAYDAMTSNRVYAQARSQAEAFEELRRCAGVQFDPDLVAEFIEVVRIRSERNQASEGTVDKQTAQRIGVFADRLTDALDRENIQHMATLAQQLNQTASEANLQEIATMSASLTEATTDTDPETSSLIQVTGELLDLCRTTQRAYRDQTEEGHTTDQ